MTTLAANPTVLPLDEARRRLRALYGDRLARIVLFGSRARGDHRDDSDYDVAVFLKTWPDWWRELDVLAGLSNDLLDASGAVFDIKPYAVREWSDQTPLMSEIRRDGIDL